AEVVVEGATAACSTGFGGGSTAGLATDSAVGTSARSVVGTSARSSAGASARSAVLPVARSFDGSPGSILFSALLTVVGAGGWGRPVRLFLGHHRPYRPDRRC